jgi:hypothetical protein
MPDLDSIIHFSGGDNVSPDDLGKVEVDNFSTAVDVALRDGFQWDGKAIGAVALTLNHESNMYSPVQYLLLLLSGIYLMDSWRRRKIRFIEGDAKCLHLNKSTCKRTLRLVFICLIPRTQLPTPLHTYTLYTCT